MSSGQVDHRNNHFNLLRLIAASLVLYSHCYLLVTGDPASEPLKLLTGESLGHYSVIAFFAISGFFIARSFVLSPSPSRFLMARALRLFPGLFAMLVLTVLFAGLVLTTAPAAEYWARAPLYIFRNLTLVSLLPDMPGVFMDNPYPGRINASLWTLFYEVACYMAVLAAGVLGVFSRPRLLWPLVVASLALLAGLMILPAPERLVIAARFALPFLLGAAIFLLWDRLRLSFLALAALAALTVATVGTPVFDVAATVAISYGVFVLGFAKCPPLLRFARGGDYSYGIYIYAFPVQQIVVWAGVRDPMLLLVVSGVVTLLCAMLSWRFVEAPALALKPRGKRAARDAGPQEAG